MSQAFTAAGNLETDSPDKIKPLAENLETRIPSSRSPNHMPAPDFLRTQMAQCGEYTFQALSKIGKLSSEEASSISEKYLKTINQTENGEPFQDALAFLAVDEWKKSTIESRDNALELTRALTLYSKTKVSHIAFAHQNETPIEFYNEFPAVSEICRLLSCPIIQVSGRDFITVTSINPFTAEAAAHLITNEIETENGRKPFSFITTTDLNAWKYTCERHFGS